MRQIQHTILSIAYLFFNIVQLAVTIPNVSGSDHHRHVMHASASVSNPCVVVEQSAQLRANTASSTPAQQSSLSATVLRLFLCMQVGPSRPLCLVGRY